MTDIVGLLRKRAAMGDGWTRPVAAETAVEIIELLRADRDEWRRLTREAATEIEWLRGERDRLAADLATAQKAILPWIEQVGWLNAKYDIHTDALRRIAHSADYDTIISPDGDRHQQAVEIALEALTDGGR